VAQTLNSIGAVHGSKNDHDKALEYFSQCLDVKIKIKGAKSIDVALTLNNIALVHD
jgi:hypothetical protein